MLTILAVFCLLLLAVSFLLNRRNKQFRRLFAISAMLSVVFGAAFLVALFSADVSPVLNNPQEIYSYIYKSPSVVLQNQPQGVVIEDQNQNGGFYTIEGPFKIDYLSHSRSIQTYKGSFNGTYRFLLWPIYGVALRQQKTPLLHLLPEDH